eukprot:5148910-Pleurochrysis_carterae.AAC.2
MAAFAKSRPPSRSAISLRYSNHLGSAANPKHPPLPHNLDQGLCRSILPSVQSQALGRVYQTSFPSRRDLAAKVTQVGSYACARVFYRSHALWRGRTPSPDPFRPCHTAAPPRHRVSRVSE